MSLTALVFDLAHLDVVGVLAEVHGARHVVVDSATRAIVNTVSRRLAQFLSMQHNFTDRGREDKG